MMHVGEFLEYRGECSVPWRVIMTVGGGYLENSGGCHEYCGGCHEYCGDTQYHRGYPDACGGYLEYHGRYSVPWRDIMKICGGYFEYRGDIMSTIGVILNTMGIFSTIGIS